MSKQVAAWLLSELPELERAGVLDAASAARLRAHYAEAGSDTVAPGLSATLGALLLGLGVILLVAHNWDQWGRALRLLVVALPLAAGQAACAWTLFRHPDSRGWRECSATFAALAFAAALALVSQIFQLGGALDRYLLGCALVGLPLLYALDSSVLAVLIGAALLGWVGAQDERMRQPLLVLLAFATLLPHVVSVWRRAPHSMRSTWLIGWLVPLVFAALSLTMPAMRQFAAFWLSAWALLLIQLDSAIGGEASLIRRPLRAYGELGWALVALAATFPDFWRESWFGQGGATTLWQTGLVAILLLALGLLCTVHALWRRRWLLAALSLPMLVTASTQAGFGAPPASLLALLFNAYVLAIGIALISEGLRAQRLRAVSSGLTLIAVLVLLRFFGSEWSFVLRGVAFVVVGLAFLAANLWLRRKVRS
ncbi:DUF2157 domain-containing protein [Solimonas terrae]|uniref:DUF2157 domain-containing protein n=1 Tax=Solimonas terrae TaxID=1396819 RepID=A0A6M2BSC9_9GAMM|nr:DUF2157 domain-containing protein [Solimonas terrae]NGY05240.1 DUF2157 domain-containing protein [Solimonas terrae]